jgi:hypothetical protein
VWLHSSLDVQTNVYLRCESFDSSDTPQDTVYGESSDTHAADDVHHHRGVPSLTDYPG